MRRALGAAALGAALAAAPAGAQAALFRSDSVLTATIRTDLAALVADDHPDSASWHPGTFTLAGSPGVPVRLRTRGLYRLQHCDFPPLRLRFADGDARGTPLAGLRRPKLVTHCKERGEYEQNLLQEYAIYRVWRLVTPVSFAARLLRVTYEDAAGRAAPVTRYALVTEDPDRVADRLGGREIEAKGIRFASMRPEDAARLGVFQYFIANTDWSLPSLHNTLLVRVADTLHAVPYDFDWAGVIGASYARPDPRLPIRSVRERIWRGPCADPATLEPALARFEALRDSIAAVYRGVPGLEPRIVERSLRYYDEFYRSIADRRRFHQRVVAPDCLRQQEP